MTLTSILALLTLPLLKRPELASKKLPEFLDPRIIENGALKARVVELETELDQTRSKLADANRDVELGRRARDELLRLLEYARRDRDHWYQTDYGALFGFQQSRAAHQNSQALAQQAQAQQMPAQQYLQALGQPVSPFQQLQAWHDCTCVPGRSAAFGILREDDQ